MLVPLSWLRDFAPFDLDPVALGEVFDDLGMVVEAIRAVGEGLEGVVVARVEEIGAIAGADRIRRVVVDVGGPEPRQIVCGAWNFGEGDLVPLATVGAVLPGDFVITQRRMKGVVSEGMICSAAELGLGEDAEGILVLGSGDAPVAGLVPGQPLAAALGIERDVVYDLAIEGNRPDAMSIAGVARDAAARLGLPFVLPTTTVAARGPATSSLVSVVVEALELCPRFTARTLTNVTIGPSSPAVRRRLTLAGMRPISAVVDASNYVMLELGQPTHPYDLDRLGPGLIVRAARPGETLQTLDGVTRHVGDGPEPDCLICDAESTPVGIGGVLGGASSEISAQTTRVVLEAANFTPMAIARTSKRLGVRTEASARFERGVDIEGIERAVERFCALVVEACPDAVVAPDLVDVRAPSPPRAPIRVRTARVNAILGTELDGERIRAYLAPIGFAAEPAGRGDNDVTVPTFRPDATREIDIIEEVARHHGYSRIARTVPRGARVGGLTAYQRDRRLVRDTLVGAGLSEAMCGLLVGPGDHARAGLAEDGITAVDPLVREESVLRTSLLPGLLRTVEFNADRRNTDFGMFEIGHVFRRPAGTSASSPGTSASSPELPELPDEREVLGVVLAGMGVDGVGSGAAGAVSALRRIEGALRLADVEVAAASAPGLHPGRAAAVVIDGIPAGSVGQIDPEVASAWNIEAELGWFEVDLGIVAGAARRSEAAQPVSRFPSSDIDLAFVVADTTPASAVEATLRHAAGELLERITLFDVYRGGPSGAGVDRGHRSLAFRLRFCALDHTLTDAELADVRERCIATVSRAHPARLRG